MISERLRKYISNPINGVVMIITRGQSIGSSPRFLLCYRWYIRYTADFGLDFCINFFNSNNRAIDPLYMYNAFYEISKKCLHEKAGEIREGYEADQIAKELCILAKGIIFDWSSSRGSYDIEEVAERMFSIYLNGVIRRADE